MDEWLEHYRVALTLPSPYMNSLQDSFAPPRERKIKSAAAGGGIVIIEREATAVPRFKLIVRPRSAVFDLSKLSTATVWAVFKLYKLFVCVTCVYVNIC